MLRSERGGAAEVLKRTEIQLEPGRTTNLSSGNEVRVRFDVPGNSGPLRMKDINRPKLIPGCYSNCKLSAVNYVGWILKFVLIPRLGTERLNIEIREAGNFESQRIDERSAGSEAPRLRLFTTFIRAICMHICTHTSISFHHRKGGVVPSFFSLAVYRSNCLAHSTLAKHVSLINPIATMATSAGRGMLLSNAKQRRSHC